MLITLIIILIVISIFNTFALLYVITRINSIEISLVAIIKNVPGLLQTSNIIMDKFKTMTNAIRGSE